MSTSQAEKYHHGDLRRALIDAGLAILAEDASPAAFSLREAARRAGVSAMAPYRHFPDKESLLIAVAAVGFDRLAVAQLEADRHGDPVEALVGQGVAYVAFACAEPALFRLMFGRPWTDKQGELAAAGARSYKVLADRVTTLVPPAQAETAALLCWSTAHGLASLALDGHLLATGEPPTHVADRVLRAFCGQFHGQTGDLPGRPAPRSAD